LSEIVRYERSGPVAIVTLHRPDSLNAFDTDLRAATVEALEKLSRRLGEYKYWSLAGTWARKIRERTTRGGDR